MNIILTMIISSHSLFLLLIIIEHFKSNLFSQRHRYAILKVALIFLVIPIACVKLLFQKLFFSIFPKNQSMNTVMYGKEQVIMFTPEGYYINFAYKINLVIICVWIGLTSIIFLWHIWKYIKSRRYIYNMSQECFSPNTLELVIKIKNRLHIKRTVRIYIIDMAISPFTIGMLRPVIVMPEVPDIHKQELIIYHELCHIKKQDVFFRLLQAIIAGIYWFNPLIYLMNSYLERCCEFACDELMTKNLSQDDKKFYGHMLIDMAALDSNDTTIYINSFSNNKKHIKERVYLIMKNRKQTNKFAVLLSIGMVVCSSFPALAYESSQTLSWVEQPQYDVFIENANQIAVFDTKQNISMIQSTVYESQFTDIYGNIYPIDERQADEKKNCVRNYVDGEYQKHTKNKNGSCITQTYSAQRCRNCGVMKLGSLQSKLEYTKCPH